MKKIDFEAETVLEVSKITAHLLHIAWGVKFSSIDTNRWHCLHDAHLNFISNLRNKLQSDHKYDVKSNQNVNYYHRPKSTPAV